MSSRDRNAEIVGGLDHDPIPQLERMHVLDGEKSLRAVEKRHIGPERLDRRPPAKADGLRMAREDLRRARLRDGTGVRRALGGPPPLPYEHARVVEIEQLSFLVQVDRREREREPAA